MHHFPLISRARRRGAALIEFALIAILFFTMLLGMIQFGLYQSKTNALWNLSREGARFASVNNPSDADIRQHVKEAAPLNIRLNDANIDIYPATTRASGQPVAVCITYDLQDTIIFPLVGQLLSRNRVLAASAPIPSKVITGYNYFTSSIMRVE